MLKPFEDMTAKDYYEIGLKSGLEIHVQLKTDKKLFCRCNAGQYSESYDAEILRHMRPTLSELGEYDGTALMEFKTRKEIIYQLNKKTVCTYEMDDAPPFELNRQALEFALEITMLLNCNVVSEIHIARKQYLDGSIPTGFQRTTILGIDGEIPYKNRKIGIIQLGLEEDACREVSDNGHIRTYKTDRLGMPLIEIVTYPDMCTPVEVAEVGQLLRQLTRMTGRVRRGIGASRQDVNVSISGGTRIEIKGVPRIPLIPLLVHNEAGRQKALLDIRNELRKRGITAENFKAACYDVTDILKNTIYQPIITAWKNDFKVSCVRLHRFKDILRHPTQPDTNFAKEISDRVRVVACLDKIPNIIHSDSDDETIGSAIWTRVRKLSGANPDDTLVIVWGSVQDVSMAEQEIQIRAAEAIEGVPSETRQALENGTNGFERILPGADRMYPDTDLPPLPLTERDINRIRKQLPPAPWKRHESFSKLGLSDELIRQLVISPYLQLFEKLIQHPKITTTWTAHLFTSIFKHWRRVGYPVERLNESFIEQVFNWYSSEKITREAVVIILEKVLTGKNNNKDELQAFDLKPIQNLKSIVIENIENATITTSRTQDVTFKYLMGHVMTRLRGHVDGKQVAEIINKLI